MSDMSKILKLTTAQKRSIGIRKAIARRTPERKAEISKTISEGVKKWHANMNEEKKRSRSRKISKSVQIRHSQIPPRMKRDNNKKKSESFKKFYATPAGREHKKYIGHLSRKDILECPLERKKKIIAKRSVGQKKAWDRLTPIEKKERLSRTVRMGVKRKARRKALFFEFAVPRINNFCGVITEEEMEKVHG